MQCLAAARKLDIPSLVPVGKLFEEQLLEKISAPFACHNATEKLARALIHGGNIAGR